MKEETEAKEEIIIIKRGGGGDDGHHGGAWKIAFADFMTAMMALFLVLWLINAANEETKQAVASYFNPVKLVDRNRSTKGLLDATGPQESDEDEDAVETEVPEKDSAPPAQLGQLSDADLQANPYGVLAEIAARAPDTNALAVAQLSPAGGRDAVGSSDSEAFRDPFDPDFWRMEVEQAAAGSGAQVSADGDADAAPDLASKTASVDPGTVDGPAPDMPVAGAAETGEEKKPGEAMDGDLQAPGRGEAGDKASPGEADDGNLERPGMAETGDRGKPGEAEEGMRAEPGPTPDGAQGKPGDAPEDVTGERGLKPAELAGDADRPADPPDEAMSAQSDTERAEEQEQASEKEADELRDTIEAVVEKIAGIDPDLAGSINVTSDEDGVLISLADELAIPMFNIGSAVPSRDLVLAMERIAAVLNEKTGQLRIYGHTDARPYRDDSYDNWRLSVARAQTAYFMLTRAGLPKARFSQVAGFADSRLRNPDQPEAAANRRIEILLERP